MNFQKLTPEQVAKIEETLALNDLDFEDLKLELTDHIASEIEVLLNEKNLSFEVAFKHSFKKWEKELQPTEGLVWVSPNITAPKIVMNKWAEDSKKNILNILVIGCIASTIVWMLFWNNLGEKTAFYYNSYLNIICVAIFSMLLISRLLIWKSKTKTSFSYMYNRRFLLSIPYLAIVSFSEINVKHFTCDDISDFFLLLWRFCFLAFALLSLQLFYKHSKFVNTIKK